MTTIYTYECTICGGTVEREATAPPPKKCLVCSGKMSRKWHVPNIIYNDSGYTGAQSKERKQ